MELATFQLEPLFFRRTIRLGGIAFFIGRLVAISACSLQLVQRFCSNKAFYSEGVENPPIEAMHLIFKQRPRFFSFAYPRRPPAVFCATRSFIANRGSFFGLLH